MAGKRLVIQSHGGRNDDGSRKYLELSKPVHEEYAWKHGADYRLFVGEKASGVHPAWNRIKMFLEAEADGYDKVVWLDADTLVVDPEQNIFHKQLPPRDGLPAEHGTWDHVPLQMTRTSGRPWWTPHGEEESYNDGVLVVNFDRTDHFARDAFRFVWARRNDGLLPHHDTNLWELNWLLDHVFAHPYIVHELPDIWNWMPFEHALEREPIAAIKAWHGMPHEDRWRRYSTTFKERYG